jgi:hypothetical protein
MKAVITIKKTIAVLVNYNNYRDTIDAVYSLFKQSYKIFKIIVVDNKSTNNSFSILREKFKDKEDIIILESDKNKGFSYGNNFAFKYSLKNFNFDYFLMINNDTIADIDMNKNFIYYYEKNKNEKIGILTGKIYYYNNNNKIWFAGGSINKRKMTGYHFGIDSFENNNHNNLKNIEFATGCLWFFSKDLIEKIGYLPEEYFMYLEDVDYSYRVIKNGYKIIYLPNVKIWHKVGSSSRATKCNNFRLSNRNRIIFSKKYGKLKDKLFFWPFFIITRLIRFFQCSYRNKKITNTFSGILEGIRFKEVKR